MVRHHQSPVKDVLHVQELWGRQATTSTLPTRRLVLPGLREPQLQAAHHLIALPSNSSLVIGGAPAATMSSTLPAGLCATPGRAESPSHDDGCVVVFWGGARRDLGRHGIAAFRQASVSFGIVSLAMAITTSAVKPSIGASCYKWPFLLLLLSFLSTI